MSCHENDVQGCRCSLTSPQLVVEMDDHFKRRLEMACWERNLSFPDGVAKLLDEVSSPGRYAERNGRLLHVR